jgi:hypothetical protein
MCWNESVSLNTFLFSGFVILLITYNNVFTKYKIEILNNIYLLLFSISVISIQLVEFFIWRNINNAYYNHILSILEGLIIFIQPVFSIMIITKKSLRNTLLFLYLLLAIPYSIYTINTKNIKTIVTEKGHLQWNFITNINICMIWLFFFLFSFIYERYLFIVTIGILFLLISTYNYAKDHSVGSMWCWISNLFAIIFVFYLLFVLPFYEKMELC